MTAVETLQEIERLAKACPRYEGKVYLRGLGDFLKNIELIAGDALSVIEPQIEEEACATQSG